ncbi:hypothetical protein AMAG_19166 [Allomyces macrogynus ATCC 38327]|uniref:Uncharacterized protein n=1 Tax=Allomyces macrogynus (strain ATCC 38327) TaxID=578462 RepID=A0A0L0SPP5_ALLM3|nr:hypothetical protein AMAG_19166 [Allomyces macrogynus ATCC 38327]|eukprot:KNE64478.1 hypothetical protein AMAG_19166 [Allomyces macrogynus ATCC 38327]
MVFDVRDKVCLITGAASGYGHALCDRLFGKGAKLVLVDLNLEAANALATKYNADAGEKRAIPVRADVTSVEDMRAAFDATIKAFGQVHVVVNNAGISDMVELDKDINMTWKKVLDIDLNAVVLGTQLALEYMAPHGGIVVNTASVAGLVPIAVAPVYCAAKHGVIGFTKSMARYAKHNKVRVNAVAPFFTDTPLVRNNRASNAKFDGMIKNSALIPIEWVTDAMVLCIEDESLVADTVAILPRVGVRKVPKSNALPKL